jgi:four helix bundle protein
MAEGYCRRSLKEYLNFLNVANASLGESLSGLSAFRAAEQLSPEVLNQLLERAEKIAAGLMRLIEALRAKRTADWNDGKMLRESNEVYMAE